MDLSAALPIFVVTLREGFEASLVVGIVLACLQKAGQSQLYRWVYQGIGGGIVASLLLGWFLKEILTGLESSQDVYMPIIKEFLGGIFALVAIAMLTWMLIWMTKQAKFLKSEVEGAINSAITENTNAPKAIFLLVFIAVLREGFETVLFIVAKFQDEFLVPGIGAVAGLSLAVLMAVLLFKWGVKINIRLFFQIMGIFLLLVVGGLVISALKDFDKAVTLLSQLNPQYANLCIYRDSCLLGPLVWDGASILPEQEFPGIILKSLFGYRQTIYLVQLLAYLVFLFVIGGTYFFTLTGRTIWTRQPASLNKS